MSRFYSVSPRVRSAIMRPRPAGADAHDPGSADYAERHRAHSIELPNGLVRIDMGEPVKPLPCQPQPVLLGKPTARTSNRPAPSPVPEAAPVAASSEPKEHRAITRNP